MNKIEQRLCDLRSLMQKENVKAFIVPSTDPHSGEYVPDHWKCREWISGFDGSAGIAVVTMDKAALWTDSRYFLHAAEVLNGTEYTLMKEKIEGTPTQAEWLGTVLQKGDKVAVDGWTNTVASVEDLKAELQKYGLMLTTDFAPYAEAWKDRPQLPLSPIIIQGLEYSGEPAHEKIDRIRKTLKAEGDGRSLLVSMLDEVAWTLNLRSDDIEFTPVFVSYLLITPDKATLYVDKAKVTAEVEQYLKDEKVELKAYEEIEADLKAMDTPVQIQPEKTNYACCSFIKQPRMKECPVSVMKIMKNDVEIKGYRSAMLKDGIALVKWLKWVVPAVEKGGQTEMSLSRKLHAFRQEQPLFMDESFATIMGYGYHGADIHYEPNDESDIPVYPEGFVLCDSGGQYRDGTTDCTRTIPLGPLTDDMRRDYTLVLRGWINLARVHFPKGTYGSQLDCLARAPMWEYGINFLHGTGHGVGSYLCVHEGPHQFRMNYMPQPLVPGMTITDEPGIYIEGSHGVRHENTMLIVEDKEGITFGPYYKFEPLTLCPVFTSPIVVEMLTGEEKDWFNWYQQHVYDSLAPHLDEEHRQWLKEVTKAI